MGYAHGRQWDDEQLEQELLGAIEALKIDHFPTHSELDEYYGNKGLSKALSVRGGTEYWANRLNIPLKQSCTSFGNKFEKIAIEDIERETGLKAEYTTPHYPYDILVDRSVKVDVKVSNLYHASKDGYQNSFNLEKKKQTCDVFIFYCLDFNQNITKKIIIPSITLSGMSQIGIGQQSKWDEYMNRWDIVNDHAKFFAKYKDKPHELLFKVNKRKAAIKV